ncbi:MAG: hypothetical protein RI900_952 [Actinomycetota bacterium]
MRAVVLPTGRRRFAVLGAVVLVVAVAAGVTVKQIWFTDRASVVGADDALEKYREGTSTTGVGAATSTTVPGVTLVKLPRHGVYRVTTAGSESVDILGGATHQYPTETTLTVTPDGCGVRLRWDLLKERHEEWVLCTSPDGVVLQPEFAFYHEFFGTGENEDVRCDVPVLVVPADGEARPPAAMACAKRGETWRPVWEVLGTEQRPFEGEEIRVTHVRMTIDDNDNYFEHAQLDWWLADNGLPIDMAASRTSKAPTDIVGDVVYSEQFSVSLASAEPMQ